MGRSYGVGDHWCALMHALRAQRCAHTTNPALAPDGLDRSNHKLVQKVIGAMGTRYGDQRSRSVERLNERESTGMEQGAATAASAKFECAERRAKKEEQKLRNLRQNCCPTPD
jgi:hypothetical protein